MQYVLVLDIGNSNPIFDITLSVEGGMIVAVSCCVALSFSTSEMASVSV